MVVDSAVQSCFCFIGVSMVNLGVGLSRAEGPTIGGPILTEADVAVGFSGLSLG